MRKGNKCKGNVKENSPFTNEVRIHKIVASLAEVFSLDFEDLHVLVKTKEDFTDVNSDLSCQVQLQAAQFPK